MDRLLLLRQGATQVAAGQIGLAEQTYQAILAKAPDDAETLSNLGAVLALGEHHAAAERACRAALRVDPGHGAAWSNLGLALHRQQRHDEAIDAYCTALRLNGSDVNACSNLGVALGEQWRMAESLYIHDLALTLAPDNAEVRNNRAIALLSAGDLAQGFAEFEWRWRTPGMQPHGIAGALWQGEALEGRSILVHDEGGFGDTLQFVRYVPRLLALGARVILRVQGPLSRLLRRSLPGVQVLTLVDALPPYDWHCPMVSLAHRLGTTLDTIPGETPYLVADSVMVADWHRRLAALRPGLRVGLVWTGAARPGTPMVDAMDRRRSMRLAALAPLARVPGVQLVSLQRDGSAEAAAGGMALFDPMPAMVDFDDTAAVVANLDLVIAVDTAVAHLAGALGRPVWLLSRYDACWRWLAGRQDSPWYPGLRLYRQPTPGDWDSVVTQVVGDLAGVAAL